MQKSVRCAGMEMGQNWSGGGVGDGVKMRLGSFEKNTIVIVLILISIATLVPIFPLLLEFPSYGLHLGSTWLPARRVPIWFWIGGRACWEVGDMQRKKKYQPPYAAPLAIFTLGNRCDQEVCHQGTKRVSLKWQWQLVQQAAMFLLGRILVEVLWGRWEVNIPFIGDPLQTHSCLWMCYLYFKFSFRSSEGLHKLHSKNRPLL